RIISTTCIVGLDFGATYSGFSYCYVRSDQKIITNDHWPGVFGPLKTNTVLQYDENYEEVISWGLSALSQRSRRRNKYNNKTKPVELFKLHLGNLSAELKPELPL